jgi:hypothetical protein
MLQPCLCGMQMQTLVRMNYTFQISVLCMSSKGVFKHETYGIVRLFLWMYKGSSHFIGRLILVVFIRGISQPLWFLIREWVVRYFKCNNFNMRSNYINIILYYIIQGGFLVCGLGPWLCASQWLVRNLLQGAREFCRWISMLDGQ